MKTKAGRQIANVKSTSPSAAALLNRQSIGVGIATTGLGAVTASSVLTTADAASVFDGDSLSQLLILMLAGLAASFCPYPWFRAVTSKAWILIGLMASCLLVSTLFATWNANGRVAWNGFWHLCGLVLFGLLVQQLGNRPLVARAMAKTLFLAAIMLSSHGFYQVAVSMPATRAEYERDPDLALSRLNINAPPGSAMRARYEGRLYSSEPTASFALTNSLAVVLSGSLIAMGFLIVHHLQRRPTPWGAVVAALLAWSFIFAIWIMTKSRTAYLAVLVVGLFAAGVAWWQSQQSRRVDTVAADDQPKSPKSRLWLTATVVGSLLIFGGLVRQLASDRLIVSEAPKSIAYRLEYWQASAKMIIDHGWTGVGLGNFQSYYPRYKPTTASEIVADPHNWLLDLAATCSVPFLVLVLIGLTAMLHRSLAAVRQLNQAGANTSGLEFSGDGRSVEGTSDGQLLKLWWSGVAAGWFMTVGLQWLLHESIDLEATGFSLLTGLAFVPLLRGFIRVPEATLRFAALIAAVCMLVCLLASGSWQASGIAIPLAAWLAIACPSARVAERPDKSSSRVGTIMVGRIVCCLLLLIFLLQTWRPVNSSWTLAQRGQSALSQGDLERAIELSRESRAADPIDPDRYRSLAQLLSERLRWAESRSWASAAQDVRTAIEELLECDPSSSLNWNFAGETMISCAAFAQRIDVESSRPCLEEAETYFTGAIDRDPGNVQLHAQLAAVLSALGRADAARSRAATAIDLSRATPHLDRKLEMQFVWLPDGLTQFPATALVRPSINSPWAQAEPICRFLIAGEENRLNDENVLN